METIKGKWIYWKWKDGGSKTWSKSFVQDIDGFIIELTDHEFYSNYPMRVHANDILTMQSSKKQTKD